MGAVGCRGAAGNSRTPSEETGRQLKRVIEEGASVLSGHAASRLYGYDKDMETHNWLWRKYTRKPFDPDNIPIDKRDADRYIRGVNEFVNSLGKKESWFGHWFKLPKAIASKFPGGARMIAEFEKSNSYNQRTLRDATGHINGMLEGMQKMMNDMNFEKSEYKNFQELERALLDAKPGEDARVVLNNITKLIGDPALEGGKKNGAKMLTRFRDLLEFTKQPDPNKPWEQKIVGHWNTLRTDMARNLYNALITTRRTLAKMRFDSSDRRSIENSMKMLDEAMSAMLFQTGVDANQAVIDRGAGTVMAKDMRIYDPETQTTKPLMVTKRRMVDGKEVVTEELAIGVKKYSPHYVIELTNAVEQLADYAQNPRESIKKHGERFEGQKPHDIAERIENMITGQILPGIARPRGETDKYIALDPVYYLNKYAQDVANYNFKSRVNYAFMDATHDALRHIRKVNTTAGAKDNGELANFAEYTLDVLNEIRGSTLNQTRGEMNSMDYMVQIINGFEYISKLGLSVKGGLKNRSQGLFNWVWFGNKGYTNRKNFLAGHNSRETTATENRDAYRNNREMLDRQLKRHALTGDIEKASRTVEAGQSAATAGSIDYYMVPKEFAINERGELIVDRSKNALREVSRKMGDLANKSAVTMRWAENKNRQNTFEIAFAHQYQIEASRLQHYEKVLEKRYGRRPTRKQLFDHIEDISGNYAIEMVKTLHFDYDNWAKARILRGDQRYMGKWAGATKVVTQFQHFKFAYFDLMFNMMKDGIGDIKGGNWTAIDPMDATKKIMSPAIARVMRSVAIQTMGAGLLAMVTGFSVGGLGEIFAPDSRAEGLVENPIASEAMKMYEWLTADEDTKEGLEQKWSAYYGKHPLLANLGPFASDVLTAGELFDFINLTPESIEERMGLEKDTSDPDWWYKVARIFNIQAARTAWHTIPAITNGQWEKAFRIETGAYRPPEYIDQMNRKLMGGIQKGYNKTKVLPNVKPRGGTTLSAQRREAAIKAMRNL